MKRAPRTKARVLVPAGSDANREEALFGRVVDIIDAARKHVVRSVNTAMVQAYWLVGREIVEVEQLGEKRAGYGDEIIERLAARLTGAFGEGFGARTLRRLRQFYLTFPSGSALPAELGGPPKRTAVLSKSGPGKNRFLAARYQMCLPTEDELRTELTREREEAERVLRLSTEPKKKERRGPRS